MTAAFFQEDKFELTTDVCECKRPFRTYLSKHTCLLCLKPIPGLTQP